MRRPPSSILTERRKACHARDGGACARCRVPLTLTEANLDRIDTRGPWAVGNLRCLCRRCCVLRVTPHGMPHEGMIANAIRDGVIPWDWRPLVWEEGE